MAIDLAPKFSAVSVAVLGDNTLVAAVTAKKIRVLAVTLITSAAVTVRFETGASGTALTGLMQIGANGGFVLPYSEGGWFETNAGALLNLELSAAESVDGCVVYQEI
jgi:hypothetical protein|tara:strand:- start:2029 stop:2349 length:321 start_codon:yes stop_codon:yes gene_type:complete